MEKDKEENKVDPKVALNKTGKTATGKPKDSIELNPQLKDNGGGLRQEAIDLAATNLDEKALTIVQRQKRARIFKRNLPKIERAREMAKRRQASTAKLKVRAEKAAREFLKRRFAGRKGTPYADLSVSQKIQVDKRLEGKTQLIKKIAMRLLPRIRRAEYQRLRSFYGGEPMKSLHNEPSASAGINESFEKMIGVFSKENQLTIKTMVERHKPQDLISIIENMIDDLDKEGNPLVDTLREMLDKAAPKNPIYESIKRKAEDNDIDFEMLEEVFNRGLDSWNGKRGTQEQFAFDRVNSYISHGKAYELDADLREAIADLETLDIPPVWHGSKLTDNEETEHQNCGTPECCNTCNTEVDNVSLAVNELFLNIFVKNSLDQLLALESLIKLGFNKMIGEEVDQEGKMARGQLSSLIKNAQSLVAKMKDEKQLDSWIQSKITKAADYINAVQEYLDNNKQDVDESIVPKV